MRLSPLSLLSLVRQFLLRGKVENGKKKVKIDSSGIAKVELRFDDSIKVKVEVKVERDSVELFFDLAYFEKSFLRVDTIKIKQLDTLKIETEKTIIEEAPFYEKFWFGGILGGVLVLLIVIASGKGSLDWFDFAHHRSFGRNV